MGGSRPDHARQTQDQAHSAGESSRGVGLRGFESHPPHFAMNPRKFVSLRSRHATSSGVFSIPAQTSTPMRPQYRSPAYYSSTSTNRASQLDANLYRVSLSAHRRLVKVLLPAEGLQLPGGLALHAVCLSRCVHLQLRRIRRS